MNHLRPWILRRVKFFILIYLILIKILIRLFDRYRTVQMQKRNSVDFDDDNKSNYILSIIYILDELLNRLFFHGCPARKAICHF